MFLHSLPYEFLEAVPKAYDIGVTKRFTLIRRENTLSDNAFRWLN